ncbi:DNA gyrase inhibitor YacG [Chenggangzhangella methanolivorans]|uniref:DNA gyrase inhibitor YacG n=1 Tax=Chenggangzhangella methanolivorans TaxID=1437009 RepID=A0A9E6UJQ4_9HYPH|nr:DNA gyrase inhibitor YacG [Chenggangzhangella methanolivorans]QZN98366.1 DNA gyrase inhibitor YacG [Chenggangzhangella methanolivorans]
MSEPPRPTDSRPAKPPRPCPICRKMSLAPYHPFCSKRCADVDLSRWFAGVYAAPAAEQDDDETETPPRALDEGDR